MKKKRGKKGKGQYKNSKTDKKLRGEHAGQSKKKR